MNQMDNHSQQYDEISLVDLAATLVRRRYAFFMVFGIVLLLGIAYALVSPERYEYSSLVQLAVKIEGKPLESTAVTLATAHNKWIPELEAEYRALGGGNLPFGVEVTIPAGTALIRILSEAQPGQSALVEKQHRTLTEVLLGHQTNLLQKERALLEGRIKVLDQVVRQLPGSPESAVAVASAIERRAELEAGLAALEEAEMLFLARQGEVRLSPKRALIIVLALVMGSLLGVIAAFFLEFLKAVRAAVKKF